MDLNTENTSVCDSSHDSVKACGKETFLQAWLEDRIIRQGPIGFAEFMEAALYAPGHGYYMAAPNGDVDYFTSVGVHPIFAEMIARHLDEVWRLFGRPDPFLVVEMAAGDGRFADHLIRLAIEHPWGSALSYVGVERSPARRKAARSLTGGVFVDSLRAMAKHVEAAVISNELFDSLPFNIARRVGCTWLEHRVGLDAERFVFVTAVASDETTHYGDLYGVFLPENGIIEMRKGLRDVYSGLDQLADRLSILTIDYGDDYKQLYNERLSQGTALAFRAHRASEDLLADPGQQDLTCHVNFTQLAEMGREYGLTARPLISQADFLAGFGIGEYLVQLQSLEGMTAEKYARERKSIIRLVSPSDLGRFRVLAQHRGIPDWESDP